jgi:hypothetical protein
MESKNSQIWQPTNQLYLPLGLSSTPLQWPYANNPQLYHTAFVNMTPSSHPRSDGTQGYLSYGPSWWAYDFPEEGNCAPAIFPHQNFTGDGSASSSTSTRSRLLADSY